MLSLNKADEQQRRFVLAEMKPSIARDITSERIRRVSNAYSLKNGNQVEGLGGGFRYATLGKPLFNAQRHINEDVNFAELARFVWFMYTGTPWQAPDTLSPLLGIREGHAVYLLYNGILKDRSASGGNVLTTPLLQELPTHDGPKTIYGTRCMLKPPRLRELGITFKQLPYTLDATA